MKHFTYISYSSNEVIFECDAEGILEADKLYELATGDNPEKQCHVGCRIHVIAQSNS